MPHKPTIIQLTATAVLDDGSTMTTIPFPKGTTSEITAGDFRIEVPMAARDLAAAAAPILRERLPEDGRRIVAVRAEAQVKNGWRKPAGFDAWAREQRKGALQVAVS